MTALWNTRTANERRQFLVDWAPALGLGLFTQLSIWVGPITGPIPGPKPASSILYLAMAVSLGYRRKAPVVSLFAALTVCAWELLRASGSQQAGTFEAFLALCVATYGVGAYSGSRLSLAAGLLLPAVVPLGDSIHREIAYNDGHLISEILPFWIWAAVFCAIGRGVRTRHVMMGLLGDRAERAEHEREARARVAVAEERARIARELHDVVAHGVGVMVVQAGAARRVLATDPNRAEIALLAVEATGRQSLAEMRRLLGILRTDPEALALAPQPGLGSVDDLVTQVRSSGLAVELVSEGEYRPLPAGVDLVAYRIVQEGLTNVIKHAGDARAVVTIGYRDERVDVEVRDDGRPPARQSDGRGHGLFGMRERVTLYGGSFEAGPGEAGGFVVRASIPTVPAQ